ncbi:transmembrane channel-like protein 5 [Parambassis ranga]|uniref:Transmembrane channel-like protein n=1 Tax=Parambassis ranga TaxID=210632 RepID=A0A6P7HVJ8_9TELE|nr:transmembrane channel-like protein 5 [Parambassis ranga]XP_028256126.1 transmembrane channel-like protein 5 [Parambassis ranga]XP_028256136.1 transmembrane channel-like protein 5 [Parambassis ranga]XP_028256144.1 transmembrane channel-like protein 5 [Parambassis ranga]XP_028256149.1 transmembrane channel-like protein 5 [Parambassis ranga]
MTSYSNRGFFNPAYHDSETLEIDKRSSSKPHHANPYAGEDPYRNWGARTELTDQTPRYDAEQQRTAHRGGWQEESWRGGEGIPMGPVSTHQHDLHYSTFQIALDSQYDGSPSIPLPSSMSGNMTMRWRGLAMRRMFPNTDPAHVAFTEDAIRNQMENEEQDRVNELVAMSTRERIRAIRELPMSFEEKKHIRNQVQAFSRKPHHFTIFEGCSENVSLSMRRCGYSVRSTRQTLELWHGIMKEIGGKFGSSVLSYFVFLKWLLMFNIFSFLINFGFITIPLLVYNHTPNVPPNVNFRGLEILTGAGYFSYTVMYYGSYSNETLVGLVEYDMQLAYFFTIAVYMVLCGIALIFSMASSFKKNYTLADLASNSAWQLLCSWDFSVTNERAVKQRTNNLSVQLKESLSEKGQRELLTLSEKVMHFGVYLGSWLLSTGLAVGCGASIYYLCQYEQQRATDAASWSLLQEAETLLVPFVVSLVNLVIPLFYSLFNKFEHYSSQRRQIYALVLRNVILRMSILGVLCYYWMNVLPDNFSCWESMVGQSLYRLVIFDFFFLMLGSFFGEFLSNVIGTRLLPGLGVPEFDVARNVLELIYAQTLAWIGIYFSPLLPAIQILKFFILFYLKKVSLTQNCQPPRRSGRAAQMQTIFIFLLFFPFFVGALSMVAYTAWRLTPSEQCGPFRGLNNTFEVVGEWIDGLREIPGSEWAVWIYQHVIRSEIFYFLLTLFILVIIYIFWQVSQGRKELIVLLRQQIVNEGKDKNFLRDKLQNLQKSHPEKHPKQKKQKGLTKQRSDGHPSGGQSNSNAMVQALLARQQLEEEEEGRSIEGVPVPSDISTSSALIQAMMARQRAETHSEGLYQTPGEHVSSSSTAARQRVDGRERSTDEYGSSAIRTRVRAEAEDLDYLPASSIMMQAMDARQQAEEEERFQWVPAPPQNLAPSGSSALIQAMLARQQAQNEFDDGY